MLEKAWKIADAGAVLERRGSGLDLFTETGNGVVLRPFVLGLEARKQRDDEGRREKRQAECPQHYPGVWFHVVRLFARIVSVMSPPSRRSGGRSDSNNQRCRGLFRTGGEIFDLRSLPSVPATLRSPGAEIRRST